MKKYLLFLFLLCSVAGIGNTSYSQVTFINVSDTAGISAADANSFSFSSIWVDIDNDDYLDLYVAHGHDSRGEFNQLFHNLRNGKFEDIRTTAFPGATPAYTGQMCWGDFNNDGFIDCYESHFNTTDDRLWLNNGNTTFKDARNLFAQPGLFATGAIFSDINSDGKLDLLINTQAGEGSSVELNNGTSFDIITPFFNGGQGDEILAPFLGGEHDMIPSYMFGNARGIDSIFVMSPGGSWSSFDNTFLKSVRQLSDYPGAAAFADIDNDGYPDLLVHYPNKLFVFHNIQGKTFVDWTHTLGLDSAKKGSHITIFFYDFDNDGYLDLFLMNEDAVSQIYYGSPSGFTSPATLPFNNPPTGELHNASLTDYDNDGFIDILHCGVGKVELWRNKGNSNRWLNVSLRGRLANANGIGARVIAYSNGKAQYRDIGYTQGNYGYLPLLAHFGFGAADCEGADVIDSVAVIWQPGGRQVIKDVRFNELAVIDQDSGIVRTIQRPYSSQTGYAFPYFLTRQHVRPDTLVSVPLSVRLPDNFVGRKLVIDQISFAIGYNSGVIDISPSKVGVRYTPPAGWSYVKSQMLADSLLITLQSSGTGIVSDSLFLGTLTFDTYKDSVTGTMISLDGLILRSGGINYKFCHDIEGDYLGEVLIDTRSSVSAGTEAAEETLTISPNPVNGGSVVDCRWKAAASQAESISISVFDVLGKEVYRQLLPQPLSPGEFSIPVAGLANGTYFIRVTSGAETMTGKCSVMR